MAQSRIDATAQGAAPAGLGGGSSPRFLPTSDGVLRDGDNDTARNTHPAPYPYGDGDDAGDEGEEKSRFARFKAFLGRHKFAIIVFLASIAIGAAFMAALVFGWPGLIVGAAALTLPIFGGFAPLAWLGALSIPGAAAVLGSFVTAGLMIVSSLGYGVVAGVRKAYNSLVGKAAQEEQTGQEEKDQDNEAVKLEAVRRVIAQEGILAEEAQRIASQKMEIERRFAEVEDRQKQLDARASTLDAAQKQVQITLQEQRSRQGALDNRDAEISQRSHALQAEWERIRAERQELEQDKRMVMPLAAAFFQKPRGQDADQFVASNGAAIGNLQENAAPRGGAITRQGFFAPQHEGLTVAAQDPVTAAFLAGPATGAPH